MEKLEVKVVVGSWKAYNECGKRALGSSYLDLSKFASVDDITKELKRQGFTNEELEETFIQDIEINDQDVCLYTNPDMTSYGQLFESYKAECEKREKCEECTGYSVLLNKYNAVDVCFNTKPSSKVIQALKEKGFKWFGPSKSWSAFKPIEEVKLFLADICGNCPLTETKQKQEECKLTLHSLVEITDYQQKFDVISKYYAGGLESWNDTPKHREFRDKHIIGGTMVLKTTDNLLTTIDIDKPGIDNTMYYDDETEGPNIDYANFENYNINIHLHNQKIYASECDFFVLDSYGHIQVQSNYREDWGEQLIRRLTEEEHKDIVAIYKKLENDYKKRLQTYWKKYQKNIGSCGYWANR